MNTLNLASDIHDELQSPSGISISFINSWLINNIGKLNVKINSNFGITGNVYVTGENPSYGEEEVAIHKMLFYDYYYGREVKNHLGAGAYVIDSIQEGDTRVRLVARSDIAKQYQVLQKDNNEKLEKAVVQYKSNRSSPRQVVTSGEWTCYDYSSFTS